MNQTFRQRSQLLQAAERGLEKHNRGDYLIAAVGVVGCVILLVMNLLGVA